MTTHSTHPMAPRGPHTLVSASLASAFTDMAFQAMWMAGLIATSVQQGSPSGVGSQLAAISVAFLLPNVLCSGGWGNLGNRLGARRLMMVSLLFRVVLLLTSVIFVVVAPPALLDANLLPLALVSVFTLGVGASAFYPARQTLVRQWVPESRFLHINSIIVGLTPIMILLGLLVGSVWMDAVEFAPGFAIGGIVLAFLLAARWYGVQRQPESAPNKPITDVFSRKSSRKKYQKPGFWKVSVRRSIQALQDPIREITTLPTNTLITIAMAATVLFLLHGFQGAFLQAVTALAVDRFHLSLTHISGLKVLLGLGIGLASLLVNRGLIRMDRRHLWALWGALSALLAVATLTQVVPVLALPLFLLVGLVSGCASLYAEPALQRNVPESLQTRFFGWLGTVNQGAFLGASAFSMAGLYMGHDWLILHILTALAVLMTVVFGLTIALYRHRMALRRWFAQNAIQPVATLFSAIYPVRVEGQEHIPAQGSFILAGNHTGWLDTLIITVACPRPLWYVAGIGIKKLPGVRWLVPILPLALVHPGVGQNNLTQPLTHLAQDEAVCLFPEGKLSPDGTLQRFRRGIGVLHHHSGAPIIPFAIEGGFTAWGYGQKFPRWTHLSIRFGPAIEQSNHPALHITKTTRQAVENLLTENRDHSPPPTLSSVVNQ